MAASLFPTDDLTLLRLLGHEPGRRECSCGWKPSYGSTGASIPDQVKLDNHLFQVRFDANNRVAHLSGGDPCPTCKATGSNMYEKECSFCLDGVQYPDSMDKADVEAIVLARRLGHHPIDAGDVVFCSCGSDDPWVDHAISEGAAMREQLTS